MDIVDKYLLTTCYYAIAKICRNSYIVMGI